MITDKLQARMDEVVAKLNEIQTRLHVEQKNAGLADVVRWKEGPRFCKIDIGSSGAWMVQSHTGEIFNIKGYGVPDHNKKQKADIGNIYTVDPIKMHILRYNYLK